MWEDCCRRLRVEPLVQVRYSDLVIVVIIIIIIIVIITIRI